MDISFIIPANKTPYDMLERCKRSVCDFADKAGVSFEVIVVEDDVVQSVGRNKGLTKANGDWIWFVDADDEIVGVKNLRAIVQEEDKDIIVFGYIQQWGRFGRRDVYLPAAECYGRLTDETIISDHGKVWFRALWNKLFRRDFIVTSGIRFAEMTEPCEDAIFIIDCVRKNARWLVLPEIGYRYMRRRGSSLFRFCPTLDHGIQTEDARWSELSLQRNNQTILECKHSARETERMVMENQIAKNGYSGVAFMWRVRFACVWARRCLRFCGV